MQTRMRAYGALLLGESASQWKRMRKRGDGWMTGGSRRCLLEPSERGRMGIQVESSSRDERMSKNSQRDDMDATSREGGMAAWRSGRELKRRSTASPSAEWSTDTDTDQRDADAGIKQRALRQAPDAAGGRGRLCGAAAAISSKREARRGVASDRIVRPSVRASQATLKLQRGIWALQEAEDAGENWAAG